MPAKLTMMLITNQDPLHCETQEINDNSIESEEPTPSIPLVQTIVEDDDENMFSDDLAELSLESMSDCISDNDAEDDILSVSDEDEEYLPLNIHFHFRSPFVAPSALS